MRFRYAVAAVVIAVALSPARAMAAEEAAGGGSWFRLIFFAINFALFVGVVVYYAGPMIRKVFQDRAAGIRSTLSRARTAFQEAQDLANRAASRMASLEAERARILKEMNAETEHQVRAIGEMAATASQRIKADAQMMASAMADMAERRVRDQLARSAAEIARGIIARNFQDADQGRMLQGFMDKLRREARP